MFRMPAYNEIPNVGLYLEQTLKYINDTFAQFRSIELTKSMISNYVKLGYLRRPVKKQYDREQIAALLFIALSKQVLSMENIGKLLSLLPGPGTGADGAHVKAGQTDAARAGAAQKKSAKAESQDSAHEKAAKTERQDIEQEKAAKTYSAETAYDIFKADFDYLLDSVFNQKVMDSRQVSGFMQPPQPEDSAAGGWPADEETVAGAYAPQPEDSAAGAAALVSDAPQPSAGPDPYVLLWQIAAADVYSLYLNELFEAAASQSCAASPRTAASQG